MNMKKKIVLEAAVVLMVGAGLALSTGVAGAATPSAATVGKQSPPVGDASPPVGNASAPMPG
ncbi:hypothetical protein [Pseudonocardia sp.]|jgi:hypothetical protein|uniref:hypothetical protein n=1 Tax=Pseudonocardia sp. TaxID=60912 RepID=UPI0026142D8F|nr:hypothetical protein [Pseudonocardia sp.]MCW2718880.1 hypothetical protein [Pseudonocardia sp.]MDT7613914.1 hypothetical protein [Pseudonocardiales bacterium]